MSPGRGLKPLFVEVEDVELLALAEFVVTAFTQAHEEQWKRKRLESLLSQELESPHEDHRVVRGVIKVAFDRCKLSTPEEVSPAALRRQLFLLARQLGPIFLNAGVTKRTTRDEVIEVLATQEGVEVERIKSTLYADLKQNQVLTEIRLPNAPWLLQRYNVALVQGLLLRAFELVITLTEISPSRLRQLLRAVRFHRLIYTLSKRGKKQKLTLDGPLSLFTSSTKYGMNLANFFPCLLITDCDWKLEATVAWGKRRTRRKLCLLSSDHPLVSHYSDRGAWSLPEQDHFEAQFKAKGTDWTLSRGDTPLKISGQIIEVPDYTLTHTDGRLAHLVWVGFWKQDRLSERVSQALEAGHTNLLFAVSTRMRGCKAKQSDWPSQIVAYKGVLSVKAVAESAQQHGVPGKKRRRTKKKPSSTHP